MTKHRTAKQVVRVYLAEQGKTQEWLARQMGIDHTLLSRVLSGYRPLTPEFAELVRRHTGLNLKPFTTKRAVA